jgi:hypothetical protein
MAFQGAKMSDSNAKEGKYGEGYSLITETINYILLAADCPQKFRTYIDCLIGIGNEKIKFDASDSEVARQAKGIGANVGKGASKGWARDRRRDLMKWQEEKNILLVKIVPGKRDSGSQEYTKSSFTLHLLEYAKQVISEANDKKIPKYGNRSTVLRQTANDLVDKLRSQPINAKNLSYFDPPTEVLKNLRSARTNLEKATRLLNKYKFKLKKSDKELIQEIEKYIASIKDRGYVENILDSIIFDSIEVDE